MPAVKDCNVKLKRGIWTPNKKYIVRTVISTSHSSSSSSSDNTRSSTDIVESLSEPEDISYSESEYFSLQNSSVNSEKMEAPEKVNNIEGYAKGKRKSHKKTVSNKQLMKKQEKPLDNLDMPQLITDETFQKERPPAKEIDINRNIRRSMRITPTKGLAGSSSLNEQDLANAARSLFSPKEIKPNHNSPPELRNSIKVPLESINENTFAEKINVAETNSELQENNEQNEITLPVVVKVQTKTKRKYVRKPRTKPMKEKIENEQFSDLKMSLRRYNVSESSTSSPSNSLILVKGQNLKESTSTSTKKENKMSTRVQRKCGTIKHKATKGIKIKIKRQIEHRDKKPIPKKTSLASRKRKILKVIDLRRTVLNKQMKKKKYIKEVISRRFLVKNSNDIIRCMKNFAFTDEQKLNILKHWQLPEINLQMNKLLAEKSSKEERMPVSCYTELENGTTPAEAKSKLYNRTNVNYSDLLYTISYALNDLETGSNNVISQGTMPNFDQCNTNTNMPTPKPENIVSNEIEKPPIHANSSKSAEQHDLKKNVDSSFEDFLTSNFPKDSDVQNVNWIDSTTYLENGVGKENSLFSDEFERTIEPTENVNQVKTNNNKSTATSVPDQDNLWAALDFQTMLSKPVICNPAFVTNNYNSPVNNFTDNAPELNFISPLIEENILDNSPLRECIYIPKAATSNEYQNKDSQDSCEMTESNTNKSDEINKGVGMISNIEITNIHATPSNIISDRNVQKPDFIDCSHSTPVDDRHSPFKKLSSDERVFKYYDPNTIQGANLGSNNQYGAFSNISNIVKPIKRTEEQMSDQNLKKPIKLNHNSIECIKPENKSKITCRTIIHSGTTELQKMNTAQKRDLIGRLNRTSANTIKNQAKNKNIHQAKRTDEKAFIQSKSAARKLNVKLNMKSMELAVSRPKLTSQKEKDSSNKFTNVITQKDIETCTKNSISGIRKIVPTKNERSGTTKFANSFSKNTIQADNKAIPDIARTINKKYETCNSLNTSTCLLQAQHFQINSIKNITPEWPVRTEPSQNNKTSKLTLPQKVKMPNLSDLEKEFALLISEDYNDGFTFKIDDEDFNNTEVFSEKPALEKQSNNLLIDNNSHLKKMSTNFNIANKDFNNKEDLLEKSASEKQEANLIYGNDRYLKKISTSFNNAGKDFNNQEVLLEKPVLKKQLTDNLTNGNNSHMKKICARFNNADEDFNNKKDFLGKPALEKQSTDNLTKGNYTYLKKISTRFNNADEDFNNKKVILGKPALEKQPTDNLTKGNYSYLKNTSTRFNNADEVFNNKQVILGQPALKKQPLDNLTKGNNSHLKNINMGFNNADEYFNNKEIPVEKRALEQSTNFINDNNSYLNKMSVQRPHRAPIIKSTTQRYPNNITSTFGNSETLSLFNQYFPDKIRKSENKNLPVDEYEGFSRLCDKGTRHLDCTQDSNSDIISMDASTIEFSDFEENGDDMNDMEMENINQSGTSLTNYINRELKQVNPPSKNRIVFDLNETQDEQSHNTKEDEIPEICETVVPTSPQKSDFNGNDSADLCIAKRSIFEIHSPKYLAPDMINNTTENQGDETPRQKSERTNRFQSEQPQRENAQNSFQTFHSNMPSQNANISRTSVSSDNMLQNNPLSMGGPSSSTGVLPSTLDSFNLQLLMQTMPPPPINRNNNINPHQRRSGPILPECDPEFLENMRLVEEQPPPDLFMNRGPPPQFNTRNFNNGYRPKMYNNRGNNNNKWRRGQNRHYGARSEPYLHRPARFEYNENQKQRRNHKQFGYDNHI